MSEIRMYHSEVPRPVGYCAECIRARADELREAAYIATAEYRSTLASTFVCERHTVRGELWAARHVIDHATGAL